VFVRVWAACGGVAACVSACPRVPRRGGIRARCSLALAGLVLGAGLMGCGSSDNGVASKSASEILAASIAAAKSASSVRLTTSSSGLGTTKLTLNASLAREKGQARLSFLGIVVEAIRLDDTLYIKGNAASDARLESVMGVKIPPGTWLKGPSSGVLAQVGSFADMTKELPLILSRGSGLSKGATAKFDGQSAIALKETAKLYTGTLYVATTGEPYPIKLIKHGRETGQTTFSGWNDPVSVSAPANAVEISQLKRKGR
jgi:hypothetical protein